MSDVRCSVERQRATVYDERMPANRPTVTVDIDGVVIRPPFGINPGKGKNKRRDRPGRRNVLWVTESFRYRFRKPMPGAKTGLKALSEAFDLVLVSARAESVREQTIRWLEGNIGFVPELRLRPHWRETSAQYKVRMVQELDAAAHIEDDPHTARWVAELVPHVLLVDWSRNRWLRGDNIHRIASLDRAPELLSRLLDESGTALGEDGAPQE